MQLLERAASIPLHDWLVVAGVLMLVGAIGWIGHSVSLLIEAVGALQERMAKAEDATACTDADLRSVATALHSRCDRLQAIVEGKSWRDSRAETRNLAHTGDITMLDLKKPE